MVLVPFGPLRWYRLVRYDGTDCSATVVPIRPLRWYRLTDTINVIGWGIWNWTLGSEFYIDKLI